MEELTGKPPVIKTDKGDSLSTGLARAGQILLAGGMVAFPTETFYGLAVNALNEEAIGRLFAVKKRRSDRPVLILIPSSVLAPRRMASTISPSVTISQRQTT